MQELYPLIAETEMLVIASPIYYFGLSAQLQAAIHRTYAIGIPGKLRKAALILSSGSDKVYDGAIFEYRQICEWMKLENIGILTAYGAENKSEEKLAGACELGRKCK
jgi:NAD(P)H-dependent FMN reductase